MERTMSLVDHLGELRKRLITVLLAFTVFLIATFIFVEDIYQMIVNHFSVKLAILAPTEILWVYFMIAGVCAIALTIPVAAHQLWLFIRPALYPHEQKVTLAYIPALFLLFVFGFAFSYVVILPIVLNFLMELSGEMMQTYFTTEKFFRFLLNMTLPFGLLFELPVVTMFLTSLGIINPYRLQKVRKYAYLVLVIIAAVITPPDLLSEILVIIPLLLLYECSILLSKVVLRRREKKGTFPGIMKEAVWDCFLFFRITD
ncbi:twin-arginine translocase subunit TatC [Bacillus tianshenii]|nr:twin-arginine translocase subunit TatC [Bacillus tianshenii]